MCKYCYIFSMQNRATFRLNTSCMQILYNQSYDMLSIIFRLARSFLEKFRMLPRKFKN